MVSAEGRVFRQPGNWQTLSCAYLDLATKRVHRRCRWAFFVLVPVLSHQRGGVAVHLGQSENSPRSAHMPVPSPIGVRKPCVRMNKLVQMPDFGMHEYQVGF